MITASTTNARECIGVPTYHLWKVVKCIFFRICSNWLVQSVFPLKKAVVCVGALICALTCFRHPGVTAYYQTDHVSPI